VGEIEPPRDNAIQAVARVGQPDLPCQPAGALIRGIRSHLVGALPRFRASGIAGLPIATPRARASAMPARIRCDLVVLSAIAVTFPTISVSLVGRR
jgi:hypothetical protein